MRYILLGILLCLSDISFGQAVWNGYTYNAPVCNRPNCAMCNAIRAQLATTQYNTTQYNTVPVATPTPTQSTIQYETRAVTRQVKHCNNGRCWYETVTEYIQVPIPTQAPKLPEPSVLQKAPQLPIPNDISSKLVPTPDDAVEILVTLLRPTPSDVFIEPGCGDGRILKAIGKICPAIGIELNERTARLARDNIGDKALVLIGDATEFNYSRATIVSMYLYPNVMEKIVPLLKSGTRVISYCHTIPGMKCTEYTIGKHTFYIGVK